MPLFVGREAKMYTSWDTARLFKTAILPKRVSLLADQLPMTFNLSVFSRILIKLEFISPANNQTPKVYTFSFPQVLGLLKGKVVFKIWREPIQRALSLTQSKKHEVKWKVLPKEKLEPFEITVVSSVYGGNLQVTITSTKVTLHFFWVSKQTGNSYCPGTTKLLVSIFYDTFQT